MAERPAATLSLPPIVENVRTARVVAVAAARRIGVDEALVDDVRLAVGEVVTRSVLRHEAAGVTDDVEVSLVDAGGAFEVVVTDRCDGAVLTDDEVGLALVRAIVPEVAVDGPRATLRWPTA